MNKSEVSKAQAFKAYVDMGAKRSINGLFTLLKDQGYRIGRSTLIRWSDSEEWEKRLPEALAGLELAQEAAAVAAQAQILLEDAGIPQDPQPTADVTAAEDPEDDVPMIPFTEREKLESCVEALAAMTNALAVTVTRELVRMANAQIDLKDLVLLATTAGNTGKAAGDVHKALNPVVKTIEKGAARAEDGQLIPNTPSGPAPIDPDAIREYILNPPRLKS